MQIFGLEKLSLVDYDGFVSATVFTGGCNFLCGFCHNSPLVLQYNSITKIPIEEVLNYLAKRKGVLEGVCISGGEPTMQKDLPDFCMNLKNMGYSVKIDTNGTNPMVIKNLVADGLIDYVAMDIKSDKNTYANVTGINNVNIKNVESSVDFLLTGKLNYEFRTTLIKEFHNKNVIKNIGEWIKGADKYFLQKFKNSENCIQTHFSAVDEKEVLEFMEILKESVPNTHLRGYDL